MGADGKNLRSEDQEQDLRQGEASNQEAAPQQETPRNEHQLRIEQLQQELDAYKDKYLRAVADLDNIRRRHERERQDLMKFGNEGLLKDFLPVLDALDKAVPADVEDQLKNASEQTASFVDGMLMIKRQLLSALEKHGLAAVEAVGQRFDPNVHPTSKLEGCRYGYCERRVRQRLSAERAATAGGDGERTDT